MYDDFDFSDRTVATFIQRSPDYLHGRLDSFQLGGISAGDDANGRLNKKNLCVWRHFAITVRVLRNVFPSCPQPRADNYEFSSSVTWRSEKKNVGADFLEGDLVLGG